MSAAHPRPEKPGARTGQQNLTASGEPVEPLLSAAAPPFPVDVLPVWVANVARELSAELQCSVDLPAVVILGLISLIANRYGCTVRARRNWVEGTNLYLVVAIPPGGSKSPVFRRLTVVLEGLEEQLRLDHDMRQLNHDVDVELLEAERARLVKEVRKEKASDAEHLLRDVTGSLKDLQEKTPRMPRLTVSDATPESIIGPLEDNDGRLAVFSAEATIFGNLARYVGGNGAASANIDVYLAGHSGDRYEVDRRSRERPIVLREVRIVMAVLTQPEPIHEVLSDTNNVARGFVDRLLVCEPDHLIGHRRYLGHDAHVSEFTEAAYLCNMQGLIDAIAFDGGRELHLGRPAGVVFDAWRDQMESKRLGTFALLAGMPEKLHAAAVRIAGLLHLAEPVSGDEISAATMENAVQVVDYFRDHALRMATDGEEERIERDAVRLAEWIAADGRKCFSLRDLTRFGPVRAKAEYLAGVIERLQAAGLVRLRGPDAAEPWWDTGRGRPSPVIEVVA